MNKKTSNATFIALLMVFYGIGIIFPVPNLALAFLVVMYIMLLAKWRRGRSLAVPKSIIVALLLQNTLMGIGMHLFGADADKITLYSQVPTLFIFIAGGTIIFLHDKSKKHNLFYLYLVIIVFNFVISSNKSFTSFAYNTRNFIVFYLAFVIGGYYINSREKYLVFKKFFINICVVGGIVGIIGFLTNEQLYVWLGAAEVAGVKALSATAYLRDGLPGYFYGDFFGTYYWRLASLFLEPVNFSSFIALGVILQFTEIKSCREVKKILKFSFLLICNVLTFGKGGLLIVGITILAAVFYKFFTKELKIEKKSTFTMIRWGTIIGVAGIGVLYGVLYSYNMHFYAIRITFGALLKRPWGYGIGSVGNVNRFIQQSSSYVGAETGVLNFWAQIGIEGLIVFMILLFRMSKECYKTFNLDRNMENFIFALMPFVLFLVFIFQENIFTTQVITGYMLIIGYKANITEHLLSRRASTI